jgi:hypothetical protein
MTARHRYPASRERSPLLRRLGAVLQLLAVLVVPPALLLTLAGNPLDPPAQLRSTDALTTAVDDRSLLWLIALAGWLLYAHLLTSLLVEALRQTRGSNLRLPLPGLMFGVNAAVASHLIAGLLMTSTLGTASGSGDPAFAGLTPAAVPAVATAPTSTGRLATPVLLTGPRAPAQASLGSATEAGSVAPFTAGVTAAAPGDRMAPAAHGGDSGSVQGLPQCRVLPPEGRDHDTLWDIAERHLGDGTRWRDIYRLNEGRLMPDGQRLTRASLIHPGWILTLPADAITLDLDRVEPPKQAAPPATPSVSPPAEPMPTPPVDAGPAPVTTGPAEASAPASQPPAERDTTADEVTADDSTDEDTFDDETSDDDTSEQSDANTTMPLAGLLTVASLGLLAVLTRRRKVAARRRPPGVRAALPGPDLIEQERRLRDEARRAQDIAATLRLALHVAGRKTPAVQLKALWQHPDGSMELIWTEPAACTPVPAPFEPTERGWLLAANARRLLWATRHDSAPESSAPGRCASDARAADVTASDGTAPGGTSPDGTASASSAGQGRAQLLAELDRRGDDPFPLLTPVGTRNGSACLVNLEIFRLISLTAPVSPVDTPLVGESPALAEPASGPAVRAEEVLAAWVHALGGAPWATAVRTYVPPRLAEVATGLDSVQVNTSRGPLYALTDEQLTQVRAHGSHFAARRATDEAVEDILELYAGHTRTELPADTLRLASDGLHPVTVLLLDAHPEAHAWTLDAQGRLRIPGVAEDLTPLRLDPDRLDRLLRLLEHAQDPPHAAPDDPQREQMLAQCAPLPTPTVQGQTRPAAGSTTTHQAPADQDADAQGADAQGDRAQDPPANATGNTAPLAVLPTSTPPTRTTTADAAGQEWQVGPVEVGVLGPTSVTGLPRGVPRPVTLEMLVFMAFHRRPMRARETWEGMWPHREYHDQTLRARRHELKTFIDPLLLTRAGHHYELDELVSTDWQRFTALANGNPDQQLAALSLVRGRPFASCELDWFHLEGQKSEIEASITDLALVVGQRALRQRDYDTARTAALAGLRGAPYEERLYRIALQSAAARGATTELKELQRRLDIALADELEPDDGMQAATRQLLDKLTDADRRPASLKRPGQQ